MTDARLAGQIAEVAAFGSTSSARLAGTIAEVAAFGSPSAARLAGAITEVAIGNVYITATAAPAPLGVLTSTATAVPDMNASVLMNTIITLTDNGDTQEAYPLKMSVDSAMYARATPPVKAGQSEGRSAYRVEILYVDTVTTNSIVTLGDLENATLQEMTKELNLPGQFEFTLPVDDDKAFMVQAPDREIRVWRNGEIAWWGVIVRIVASGKELKVTCATLDWYFTKRVFGRPGRINYFTNSSFEEGTAGWVIGFWPGSYPYERFGASGIVQDTVVEGQRALTLEQRSSVVGGVSPAGYWAAQSTLWTVDPATVEDETKGEEWTAVVWMYVKSSEFNADEFNEHIGQGGITLVRFSTTSFYWLYEPDYGEFRLEPTPLGVSYLPFDGETFDKWIRMETPILQPNKNGEPEQISLFIGAVPGAKIRVDNVSLTRVESSIWKGIDQGDIFEGIITHAQDTSFGKSNLFITPKAPTTGILRTRVYKHQDHQLISDALAEFPTLHQGMDWAVTYTPTTRTAEAFYPRRGTRKPWGSVEIGKNVVSFGVSVDGQRVANSVIVIGEGEGSDVEEGGASDPTTMSGLVLEKIFRATPGSSVASLGEQAIRGLNRFKERVEIPEVVIKNDDEDYYSALEVGDIIPVDISYGWVNVTGDHRIIQIKHDPNTELTTLVLNPMTEEFL